MTPFICFNYQGSTGYLNVSQIISIFISPSAHQVMIETTSSSEQYRYITLNDEDAKDFLQSWGARSEAAR